MARVAFIVDEMFEDRELREPLDRIRAAGHEVTVIGVEADKELTGKKQKEKITTDIGIEDADAEQFDALVIPGGYSPDHLRMNADMVDFVQDFFDTQKLVAAVCHAPSILVDADVLEGRTVTSWPSVKNDLINAGAEWVDREVVEDGNLITSRKPDDLPAFCDAILQRLEATGVGALEVEEEARA